MGGLMRARLRKPLDLAASLTLLLPVALEAQSSGPTVTQPVISEEAVPTDAMAPVAPDGHVGQGFLRKPPGDGPFPAVLVIPGGGSPPEMLRRNTIGAYPSRFLEAGYVVAVITHRNYGLQDTADWSNALADALAALHYLKALPFVDPDSVAVNGCSIGGDVALELAGGAKIAATVAEEPGTGFLARLHVLFDLRTPEDNFPVMADPLRYYTPEAQAILQSKVRKIDAPLLIVQGDRPVDSDFFLPLQNELLLPELESAGTRMELLTYPQEAHCFAMSSVTPAGVEAFDRIESFIRQHIATQPTQMNESMIEDVPASINFGRPSIEVPLETLDDYVGTYVAAPIPGSPVGEAEVVTLRVQDGRLVARSEGSPEMTLLAESETRFFSEMGDVEFARDGADQVTHFTFGGVLTFERVRE